MFYNQRLLWCSRYFG